MKCIRKKGKITHVGAICFRIIAICHLQQRDKHCQAQSIHQAYQDIEEQAYDYPVPEMRIEIIKVLEILFE